MKDKKAVVLTGGFYRCPSCGSESRIDATVRIRMLAERYEYQTNVLEPAPCIKDDEEV